MKKALLTMALLLIATSAVAEITWNPNNDPFRKIKRAVVHNANEAGGILSVRIDSPENIWLVYMPSDNKNLGSEAAEVWFKVDALAALMFDGITNDTDRLRSYEIIPGENNPAVLRYAFRKGGAVMVMADGLASRGNVDEFSLIGYSAAFDHALAYVEGGWE